jgi:hypothetical protein
MIASQRISKGDLDFRRPVWEALSDLYLDTGTPLFEKSIIEKLATSPYSLTEIEDILIHEVRPVCLWNAFAWEWEGFDSTWLETEILRNRRSSSKLLYRLLAPFSKRSWNHDTQWTRIKASIVEKRSAGSPSTK